MKPTGAYAVLNAEQYAAVTAKDDRVFVLAGPGTGKTTVLTYRVCWLLDNGTRPDELVLLTFTNAAADEMLKRITQVTGKTVPYAGTFHSVFWRLLNEASNDGILDGVLDADIKQLRILSEQEMRNYAQKAVTQSQSRFLYTGDTFLSFRGYLLNSMCSVEEAARVLFKRHWQKAKDIASEFRQVETVYEQLKRAQNAVDFDDVLEIMFCAAKHYAFSKWFSSRFTHILVDEFQDTSPLQIATLEQLSKGLNVFAVGDDAQSIYGFRGVNIQRVVDFVRTCKVYKLRVNYRSSADILMAVNKMLPVKTIYRRLEAVNSSSAGPVVEIINMAHKADEPMYIRRVIPSILADGYKPQDIAVLTRTNDEASRYAAVIAGLGIPARAVTEADNSMPKDAVTVCTVHKSKGLEWPVVVVTSIVDQDYSAIHVRIADLDEEARLFYVAISRAKERLYVLTTPTNHLARTLQNPSYMPSLSSYVLL